MPEFEIGVVYRKETRHFIAVSDVLLVSCAKGLVTEVKPYGKSYSAVRSISVEALCDRWDISLDQFDLLMDGYLTPPQTSIKPRPRGERRKKGDDDEYWQRHRTGRISRPKL